MFATQGNPLRIAIIGSGPAGFYVLQHLSSAPGLNPQVDMFEKLPTPYGLVRLGVAPDHARIKEQVMRAYDSLARYPGFRFFGNIEYGRDIRLEDLRRHYHQMVFCTGAQSDRRLGVPGEDLEGSHSAREFVAWYNGHPDYSNLTFDFRSECAAVIGVGNVALDVARILCREPEELVATDVADYALEALRNSRIRGVYLLGRRGPAQAAFGNHELHELEDMANTETRVRLDEPELDHVLEAAGRSGPDRLAARKVEILKEFAAHPHPERERKLEIRFLVSPVEILGGEAGRVRAIRLVRNRLHVDEEGRAWVTPTGEFEELACGLVFRAVGYRAEPLQGLPFDGDRGVVPNAKGRVLDGPDGEPIPGHYVCGWIKRGPTGLIGSNKVDAKETVACMIEDLRQGRSWQPDAPQPQAVDKLLEKRGVRPIRFADWLELDHLEVLRGQAVDRPRVKFTHREDFLRALEEVHAAE